MTIHYNKNFVDLNNIDRIKQFGDTSHRLVRKENIFLIRQTLDQYITRENKVFWGYFRV